MCGDGMLADVLDLLAAEFVTFVALRALLAGFVGREVRSPLVRGEVESYDIDILAGDIDLRPAAAVKDDAVGLIADDAVHVFDGVFRGDGLRVAVAVSADIDIFVSVAGGEFFPVVGKVTLLGLHIIFGVGVVDTLGLCPDADDGILFLYEVHETVVVVVLAVPHSVLDVPVKQAHGLSLTRAAPGEKHRRKKQ